MSSIASPATPWLEDRHQIKMFDTPSPPMSPLMSGRFCWESPYNNVYASAWWMNVAPRSHSWSPSPKGTTHSPEFDDKIDFLALSLSPGASDYSSSSDSTIEEESSVEEDHPDAETESQWAVIEKLVYEAIGRLEVDAVEAREQNEVDDCAMPVFDQLCITTREEFDFSDDSELGGSASPTIVVRLPKVSYPPKVPHLPSISDMKISAELEASNPEQAMTARNVCMWGRRLERIPKVRLPGQAEAVYCFDPKRLAPKMERLLRVRYGSLQGLPGGGRGRVGLPVTVERKVQVVSGGSGRVRIPFGTVNGGNATSSGTWRGAGLGFAYGQSVPHAPLTSESTPSKPIFSVRNFPSLPSMTPSLSPSYPAFASYSRYGTSASSCSSFGSQTVSPSPAPRVSYSSATMRSKQAASAQGQAQLSSAASSSDSYLSWRRPVAGPAGTTSANSLGV